MKNKNNFKQHQVSQFGGKTEASNSPAVAVMEAPVEVKTEATSSQFAGLTREQFIAVELLKAGADLAATAQIVGSTDDSETTLKSFVAPAIKVASKNPTNSQAVVATAAVVTDLIKGNLETKNDFVKVAKVVGSLGVALESVTLADLV